MMRVSTGIASAALLGSGISALAGMDRILPRSRRTGSMPIDRCFWYVVISKFRNIGRTHPMPELPEVETNVRMLIPDVEGKRIAAADLRLGRMLLGMPPKAFADALEGQAV